MFTNGSRDRSLDERGAPSGDARPATVEASWIGSASPCWALRWKMELIGVVKRWLWVKIEYPNNWMVNTKNRLKSVVPQVLHFDSYPDRL